MQERGCRWKESEEARATEVAAVVGNPFDNDSIWRAEGHEEVRVNQVGSGEMIERNKRVMRDSDIGLAGSGQESAW
eukprot:750349-Hanusia_phi.AAC.1